MQDFKGLLVPSPLDKDTNVIVDVPFWMPLYSIGTDVEFQYKDPDTNEKHTVCGKIVGIEMSIGMNENDGTQSAMLLYRVKGDDMPKDMEPIDVLEDEITLYYPETNELSPEYYNDIEEENDEPTKVVTEADVLASQERAAGGKKH